MYPHSQPAFIYSAPIALLSTTTARRQYSPVNASSSSHDEQFFVPSHQRSDTRRRPNQKSSHNVSAQRARLSRSEGKKRTAEHDDELIQSHIIEEKISAADLLGGDVIDQALSPGDVLLDPVSRPVNASVSSEITGDYSGGTVPVKETNALKKKSKAKRGKLQSASSVSDSDVSRKNLEVESQRRGSADSSDVPFSKPFIDVGDLVNHERHGIGRFLGLERTRRVDTDSSILVQEYAVIEYRDGDVYVPLSHFDLIRRLSDDEAKGVSKLDVMSTVGAFPGHGRSSRSRRSHFLARHRTREKIRRQLVNLHGLYAQRSSLVREPFPVDKDAEEKFSNLCSFELTEDQKCATNQILSDMSDRRRPMDRLLCGDVGFGKTEVAVRAAFRAIRAGRIVVILAPTTILAQQHYQTFRNRLQSFDPTISVACFNRFVRKKVLDEQRVLLAQSKIDVAIGTHVLLSDRMVFSNLGLLVVDEEHRFGVNQKEKVRDRYRKVDTLFLSATPIPRTLHLSLSGLRDASVLQTPPPGRKPVITRIGLVGSGVVREAITKEIRRGGQIFYVVPRIEGIGDVARWIEDLLDNSDIRIMVAHGALADLEQRIWAFSQHEYDILLCTSVIENGLDMPRVNTIIVQDADRFGLAQLHQLRGRVGRGDVQAYAWLFCKSDMHGNISAFQRLKALEENSYLGSGFIIAQRDMEMRGVGSILGVEQHGKNAVGAEEYAEMLAEELEHVRTGKPIPLKLPSISVSEVLLPVASFIPEDYVSNFEQKMSLYKDMTECQSHQELIGLGARIEGIHGPMPSETRKHITLLQVKLFAKELGIRRIMAERQHVILEWAIEEAPFKRLVAALSDKMTRDRCELIEMEERVVVRGLGIASGNIQISTLFTILERFCEAASGFSREGETTSLGDALSAL